MIGDEVLLKRAVRYLQKHPRLIVQYPWHEDCAEIVVYTDSDWGGCTRTRGSTSGGLVMRGNHLTDHAFTVLCGDRQDARDLRPLCYPGDTSGGQNRIILAQTNIYLLALLRVFVCLLVYYFILWFY